MSDSEFDRVRSLTDPVRQAVEATELMGVYQQRSIELARLRRAAIDQVASSKNQNFTELAASLGLSKGRISQIRKTAPPAHRNRIGIGPIDVIWVGADDEAKTEGALSRMAVATTLEQEYRFIVKTSQVKRIASDWRPTRDSILIFTEVTPDTSFEWLRSSLAVRATRDASTGALALSTKDGSPLTPDDTSWCFMDRRLIDAWTITTIVVPGTTGLLMATNWIAAEATPGIQSMPEDDYTVVLTSTAVRPPKMSSSDHPIDFVHLQGIHQPIHYSGNADD